MKVIKISPALLKWFNEVDFLLDEIQNKTVSRYNAFSKAVNSAKKSIFKIKKIEENNLPIELFTVNNLLLYLNDILRFLIVDNLNFKKFANALDKLSANMKSSSKKSYYDFFRACGDCASCCDSPYVFSFEHSFIDKYRDYLKRKGLSYVIKSNPKTGLCSLYDSKTKKCTVYKERPLDCTFFPFSFIIKKISRLETGSRYYIFLIKATNCEVANRLSSNDTLEALEMICYVLSKISLEEALKYSSERDPRRMLFDISVPYDERKEYGEALKKILYARSYMR